MSNTKYSELLRDPRWQKKRLEVFERDKWTCQWCGHKEETLNVHHLFYQKGLKPWEYNNNKLITLCQSCHTFDYEERESAESDLVTIMKQEGFSYGDIHELAGAFIEIGKNGRKELSGKLWDIIHFITHLDDIEITGNLPSMWMDAMAQKTKLILTIKEQKQDGNNG